MGIQSLAQETLEDVDPPNVFGRKLSPALGVQASQALQSLFRWPIHIRIAPGANHELPQSFQLIVDLRATHRYTPLAIRQGITQRRRNCIRLRERRS
jgi:hypothetical protein